MLRAERDEGWGRSSGIARRAAADGVLWMCESGERLCDDGGARAALGRECGDTLRAC